VADAASECSELKATVRALRQQLESERAEHSAMLQETERRFRGELRELQDTIQALRAQLERRGV
jgi:predicted nuclease with TOPRIM domain